VLGRVAVIHGNSPWVRRLKERSLRADTR